MARWLRKTETIFKLGLLAFFLLLLWTSRTYPEAARLFPELLLGVTIILIIASFLQELLKPKGEGKKGAMKEAKPPSSDIRDEQLRLIKELEEKSEEDSGYELLEEDLRKKRLFQSILITFIALIIGYLWGFLFTVPFYFIAFGILHGQRKQIVKYIIIACGMTIITYLCFTSLMGVPLLQGLWWG